MNASTDKSVTDRRERKGPDEPGACPACGTAETSRPYREDGTLHSYLVVWCYGCRHEQRIGC